MFFMICWFVYVYFSLSSTARLLKRRRLHSVTKQNIKKDIAKIKQKGEGTFLI